MNRDYAREKYEETHYNEILPNLYLGPRESQDDYKKFDLAINLNYPENKAKKWEVSVEGKKPKVISLGMIDGCIDKKKLDKVWNCLSDMIHHNLKNDKKVIVHCMAGRSRSASTVIAYLIKHKKMSYDEAYKFVKSKRSIIDPNEWFVNSLKNL